LLDRIDEIKHHEGQSNMQKKEHGVRRKTDEEIQKEMMGDGWNPFEFGLA